MFFVSRLTSLLLIGLSLSGYRSARAQNLYDVPEAKTILGVRAQILSLAFSPDGSQLSSLGYDGKWRIWKMKRDNDPLKERNLPISTQEGTPFSLRRNVTWSDADHPTKTYWNKQGQAFALTDEVDQEVEPVKPEARLAKLWRFDLPEPVAKFQFFHMSEPSTLDVSPARDKVVIATGHFYYAGMELFDAVTGKKLREFEDVNGGGTNSSISPLFSPDACIVAAGFHNDKGLSFKDVGLWNADTGKRLRSFPDSLRPLAFSPDGRYLLMLKEDCQSIECRSVTDGTLISAMSLPSEEVKRAYQAGATFHAVFLSNSQCVIFAPSRNPRIWNIADSYPNLRNNYGNATPDIYVAALSPDKTQIATGHFDGTVTLWYVRLLPKN